MTTASIQITTAGIEVADLVRLCGDAFLDRFGHRIGLHKRRALFDIARCRTATMGGHIDVCDTCGAERNAYNSCRNRHCPKCMGSARFRWTAEREADLLPVPYFHVVFTLPHLLAPLALANPRVVYRLLFRAAADTLREVSADPKHLGASVGFLAVLHTWGQKLDHHPHLHCIVPAGGLSPDQERWIPASETFFLPVKILSRVFRGKFLDLLYGAYDAGELTFPGQLAALAPRPAFKSLLKRSKGQDWVVYSKRPFGDPQQVLRYLARYTHRVAITNARLIDLVDGRVRFRYKDYADGNRHKTLTLTAVEFIRRFLMHVLPPGFVRIRYTASSPIAIGKRPSSAAANCSATPHNRLRPYSSPRPTPSIRRLPSQANTPCAARIAVADRCASGVLLPGVSCARSCSSDPWPPGTPPNRSHRARATSHRDHISILDSARRRQSRPASIPHP